ncbi:MAG TPA: amidase family protein, partial [Candidatus Binatia bacterium]|nr:amidase family protein [Candidatus Binatia bacterium]
GLPLDSRVREVLRAQRQTFVEIGCLVEEAVPDFTGAEEAFLTLRAWNYWHTLGPLLDQNRDKMKPEAVWQIESGRDLTGDAIAKAMQLHGELMQRMRRFQEKYEFLICAVNQVPPFDARLDWPHEIDGVEMETYLDWMKSAYWITSTFCPAISVPAGFTPDGLPVGIQLVGRYRDDLGVLQLAHAFEQMTGFGKTRPSV